MGEESGYNSDAAVSDPLDLNLKTEVDLEVYSAVLNTLDDPIDDNEQFIFDEESSRLLCIASNLEHIPSKIIDEYAHRTKVNEPFEKICERLSSSSSRFLIWVEINFIAYLLSVSSFNWKNWFSTTTESTMTVEHRFLDCRIYIRWWLTRIIWKTSSN